MGVSDRRKRETEVLRQRVLEVAEEIMAREGTRHVTMRRIAASVEYAPTVLYRLFADKDDLMHHLIARGYEGVRRAYDEVLSREGQGPLKRLAGLLEVYVAFAIEHPNHYRMWFETGELRGDTGRLKMRHGRLEYVVFENWLDCIEECVAAGLFPERDTAELFQIVWSRIHGVISLRLQHPSFHWMPLDEQLEGVLCFVDSAHG